MPDIIKTFFFQEFFAENLITRIEELLDNMDVSSQEYLKKVRKHVGIICTNIQTSPFF